MSLLWGKTQIHTLTLPIVKNVISSITKSKVKPGKHIYISVTEVSHLISYSLCL